MLFLCLRFSSSLRRERWRRHQRTTDIRWRTWVIVGLIDEDALYTSRTSIASRRISFPLRAVKYSISFCSRERLIFSWNICRYANSYFRTLFSMILPIKLRCSVLSVAEGIRKVLILSYENTGWFSWKEEWLVPFPWTKINQKALSLSLFSEEAKKKDDQDVLGQFINTSIKFSTASCTFSEKPVSNSQKNFKFKLFFNFITASTFERKYRRKFCLQFSRSTLLNRFPTMKI